MQDDEHTDVSISLDVPVPTPTRTGVLTTSFALDRGTQLGEYEIEGPIGEGGMGVVFSAVHPLIGKRAAIKVLRPELCEDEMTVERFIDEARVVNQIGHPNIVDIFAFGEMPDGRRYFVMEWLKGETLRERLRRGRMTVSEMTAVVKPLSRALEAAHELGIVHRDLKPENIFLVEVRDADAPHVKLLDFGVAKLSSAGAAHRMYKTGVHEIVGTPMYIAPEQARGGDGVDARADLYALGAIAFEMLCGRPPFLAETMYEMVAAHLEATPPVPSSLAPGLAPDLDALLLAMLAKDPAARPSLADVRRRLDPAQQTPVPRGSIAVARSQVIDAEPPRKKSRAGLAIAAGAVGLAAIAFVLVAMRGTTTAPADAPTVAAVAPVLEDAAVPADAPPIAVDAAPPVLPAPVPHVPHRPRPAAPTTARAVLEIRGTSSATITYDGHTVVTTKLDTPMTIGIHELVVAGNGYTRRLRIDVKPGGPAVVLTLPPPLPKPRPPVDDNKRLLAPGSLD